MLRKHALVAVIAILFIGLPVNAGVQRTGQRPHQTCSVSAEMVPSCGVYWGAYSDGFQSFESLIGRKLAIIHDYVSWTHIFPTKTEVAAAGTDSLLFIDWALDGGPTWTEIASGAEDAQIRTEAAALNAYGRPIMVTFEAEMDRPSDAAYGTPADYVAAWRHIHAVFASAGVHNVIWVWDVTGYTARGQEFSELYPGDSYVNWIMWDPYNWYGCKGGVRVWKSFNETVSPMYDWLVQHSGTAGNGDYLSKPWGLAEYGTVEGPAASSKSAWFKSAVSQTTSAFPQLKALVYFDSDDLSNGRTCRWDVDTSETSLQGFQSAGDSASAAAMPF